MSAIKEDQAHINHPWIQGPEYKQKLIWPIQPILGHYYLGVGVALGGEEAAVGVGDGEPSELLDRRPGDLGSLLDVARQVLPSGQCREPAARARRVDVSKLQ